jgi:glycerophosphoryl diester phosphodiesterase
VPALRTPLRRVGHKGADLIVPGNTLASFDAALAAGVDMIEFDVLPDRPDGDRLVLAHDFIDAADRAAPELEAALAHLAGPEFAGVELDVDLKLPGYEREVVAALRRHALVSRSLISSQYRESLAEIRSLEPALRLGWSVPKVRRDPFRSRVTAVPAVGVLLAYREALPARAAGAIRSGAVDAVMAQWRLVTPRLVRRIHDAGGELYVWTVDEPRRLQALAELGADGLISNDPRLFAALTGPAAGATGSRTSSR